MINEMLGTGAAAATPARVLINTLGIDTRTFYATVERERRDGYPICASKRAPVGYYLAATRAEADDYASIVNMTAHEMRRTARAIRKAGAKLPDDSEKF